MTVVLGKVQAALDALGLKYKVMDCDPTLADTAQFCEAYNFRLGQSANAIIVASKGGEPKFCCCVVLATTKLDVNNVVRKLMSVRKASFATAEQTRELTGMEIGGVTPIGLPEDLPIYVDAAVMEQAEVVIGGGNRSSKIIINPQEFTKVPNVTVVEYLAKSKE
jgi:Uncharacterized conserved protein